MKWASPWEGAGPCTSGPAPGARALAAWGLEEYDEAYSMGIYNCRTVRGSQQRSIHGEGRAWDMGFPVINGKAHADGHKAVRRLGAVGDKLGIQAIIFDRTIWSAASPNGRPYGGVHPHLDHLHIELTRHAAQSLTLATLRHHLSRRTPERSWFDMATEADLRKIVREELRKFPGMANDVVNVGQEVYVISYSPMSRRKVKASRRDHFRNLAKANPQFRGPWDWDRTRLEDFPPLTPADE